MIRNTTFEIYDFVTFQISKVLERVLDELEYRVAKHYAKQEEAASTASHSFRAPHLLDIKRA